MVATQNSANDVPRRALVALEKLGEKQTLENLGVALEELQEMLLGNVAFPDEVVDRLARLESIWDTGKTTASVTAGVQEKIPEASRSEAAAAEAPLLPERDGTGNAGARSRMFDQLKADLYGARLIATRNLKDLRLRDDEILTNQIVIYEIELTIIMDFQDTVPVPGLGWTKLQMHEEAQRRTRELRATHSALQRYDRGMKGIMRRWAHGKRQTPREMLNEMLSEADALHRAGESERAESPEALLHRVLEPAGLDADVVRKLLVGSPG